MEDRIDVLEDKNQSLQDDVDQMRASVAYLVNRVGSLHDRDMVMRDCVGEVELSLGVVRMRTQHLPMPAIMIADDDEYVPVGDVLEGVPDLEPVTDEEGSEGGSIDEGLAIRIAAEDPAPEYGAEGGRLVLIEEDPAPAYLSSPEL